MDDILIVSLVTGVGCLMTVLSVTLLRPVLGDPLKKTSLDSSEKIQRSLRSAAGFLFTGMLAWLVTSNGQAAVMAAAIPPFLWTVIYMIRNKEQRKRRALITREFPLLLDFLVLQIESGHSIQKAVRSAHRLFSSSSPLHGELVELDESLSAGCSMVQALERFGQRLDNVDAAAPVSAISQAVGRGTPLGKVLREQSRRMREHLILEGEQFANTLSVKILIPLLFFIFPASFLVIFSPVIVSLSGRLQ